MSTYSNPVLFADYCDPDVIRVGGVYYMVASSFNWTPGLPILSSTDLVTWTLIGHALEQLPDPSYAVPRQGCGVWAPSIREHAGKFYIFWPSPDEGIYVTMADHPAGTWSPSWLLIGGKGLIDPCPYWDEQGNAWLVHAYAFSRAKINNKLHLRPMSPDCRTLLGEGKIIYDAPDKHPVMEGPKTYKKDGWFYIFAPAGGVPGGWQTVLRSRNVDGPFDDRIVLDQGTTPINGPHQGALVDTPSGEWWFLHFQSIAPYGRIVHLQPVSWQDGWPVIGIDATGSGVGEPVLTHRRPDLPPAPVVPQPTTDLFNQPRLGLQWQWQANSQAGWSSLSARPGFLRLTAQAVPSGRLEQTPNLLAQKFVDRAFRVVTAIEERDFTPADRAGLVITGGQMSGALVARDASGARRVDLVVDGQVKGTVPVGEGPLFLRLDAFDGGHARYFVRQGQGPWQAIHYVATVLMGSWVGAKFGLVAFTAGEIASGATADFPAVVVGSLHEEAEALALRVAKPGVFTARG